MFAIISMTLAIESSFKYCIGLGDEEVVLPAIEVSLSMACVGVGGEVMVSSSEFETASSEMWFSLVSSKILSIVTTSTAEHRKYPSDLLSSRDVSRIGILSMSLSLGKH